MRSSLPSLVSLVLVLGVAAGAWADINVTVLNADKVQGTIDTSVEIETFTIECPADAKFTVVAKGKKGFAPTIQVLAPDQAEPYAQDIVEGKTSSKLKVPALLASGRYTVRVRGRSGATGEYKLSVKWASPKQSSADVEALPEATAVPFSAGAGTSVNLKAIAAKKSAAVPELVRLEGPRGYLRSFQDVGKAASDSAQKITLPETGAYTLFIRDSGTTGGAVKATIALKQPKPSKRKVDLRAKVIGSAGGEQFAVSDVVGTGGGSVVVPLPGIGEDPISSIAGSGVVLPSGAVDSPTAILVATAPDLKPKSNDVGAGPSVFFGPEGLTFKSPVTVTIPWDVEAFGEDTSTLVVYTRDAKGKVKAVPGPYQLDAATGTCTFPVSHFSSFRAARDVGNVSGNNAPFVGAWRELGNSSGFEVYVVFRADGSVFLYEVYEVEPEECFFSRLLPPGTDFSLFSEIVDGELAFGDGQSFERASASAIPPDEECTFFDIGLPLLAPPALK